MWSIQSAEIIRGNPVPSQAEVIATFRNGEEEAVCRYSFYFDNEVDFTASEFVGLTPEGVADLFQSKSLLSLSPS